MKGTALLALMAIISFSQSVSIHGEEQYVHIQGRIVCITPTQSQTTSTSTTETPDSTTTTEAEQFGEDQERKKRNAFPYEQESQEHGYEQHAPKYESPKPYKNQQYSKPKGNDYYSNEHKPSYEHPKYEKNNYDNYRPYKTEKYESSYEEPQKYVHEYPEVPSYEKPSPKYGKTKKHESESYEESYKPKHKKGKKNKKNKSVSEEEFSTIVVLIPKKHQNWKPEQDAWQHTPFAWNPVQTPQQSPTWTPVQAPEQNPTWTPVQAPQHSPIWTPEQPKQKDNWNVAQPIDQIVEKPHIKTFAPVVSDHQDQYIAVGPAVPSNPSSHIWNTPATTASSVPIAIPQQPQNDNWAGPQNDAWVAPQNSQPVKTESWPTRARRQIGPPKHLKSPLSEEDTTPFSWSKTSSEHEKWNSWNDTSDEAPLHRYEPKKIVTFETTTSTTTDTPTTEGQ